MTSQDKPEIAFILSLIGGILILIAGLVSLMWFMFGGFGGMMDGFRGMMVGWQDMMKSLRVSFVFMSGLSLVAGILVIIGALMLDARPAEHITWGTIILVFSLISFLGMGGFFLGAILGVVGGALALAWQPISKT